MIGEKIDFGKIKNLLKIDQERIELGRKRQTALWKGEKPDAWPIYAKTPLAPEQEAIPNADYAEAYRDGELMLCSQLRSACASINSGSDAVPSMRANLGTGITLSTIGLEQLVFHDKMPWLKEHLTREEVAKLEPDDIKIRGDFETGLAYMRLFRDSLDDVVPVYCMDTQGPLDLAHLILGDEIFLAMFDDKPLVHHLMEIALEIGIRTHTWMKEVISEDRDRCHHGNQIYAENMGVRVCEDTSAIIGPDQIAEFSIPYQQRIAEYFGGAWIHYCGRNDHLTAASIANPLVRGINFGHIPGHEELHDFEEDMEKIAAAGKVYIGSWPRYPGESGREYLQRLHRWAKVGAIMPVADPAIGVSGNEEELFSSSNEALEYWYSL